MDNERLTQIRDRLMARTTQGPADPATVDACALFDEVVRLRAFREEVHDMSGAGLDDDAAVLALVQNDINGYAVCEMEHQGPHGWRPVEGESAPTEGDAVIVWAVSPGTKGCVSMQTWNSAVHRMSKEIGITYTHWMPLPSGPEEG